MEGGEQLGVSVVEGGEAHQGRVEVAGRVQGGEGGRVPVGRAHSPVQLERVLALVREAGAEHRCVSAIQTEIQLPNGLPIILNCAVGIIN